MAEPEAIQAIKQWLGSGAINIFGPPYAGKDTHGHKIANILGAELLGGGEILRSNKMPESVKALHKTGKLFPTDVYFQAVLPYLRQTKYNHKPLILSSVGRKEGEENGVLEAAALAGHPIKAVIYLNASDSTVWNRWEHSDSRRNRGEREDDSAKALKVRLLEFRSKTIPVIDFYRQQNLLIEIDSNRAKDIVSKDILGSLLKFSNSRL